MLYVMSMWHVCSLRFSGEHGGNVESRRGAWGILSRRELRLLAKLSVWMSATRVRRNLEISVSNLGYKLMTEGVVLGRGKTIPDDVRYLCFSGRSCIMMLTCMCVWVWCRESPDQERERERVVLSFTRPLYIHPKFSVSTWASQILKLHDPPVAMTARSAKLRPGSGVHFRSWTCSPKRPELRVRACAIYIHTYTYTYTYIYIYVLYYHI